MKKLLYAATMTLACLSSVSTVLVSSSIHSAALAADRSCLLDASSATTGGAVRSLLDAVVSCNTTSQTSTASVEQAPPTMPIVQNTGVEPANPTSVQQSMPSSCQSSHSLTTGGGIREQLSAIANCNFTSQVSSISTPSLMRSSLLSTPMINTATKLNLAEDNRYPTYCPEVLGGLQPGDAGFREALAECKYGS